MTDVKHTPGPWAVDPIQQGILGDVSTADGEQCVAQAQQIMGDDRKQSRREANARLIAAAPDLLTMLKHAVHWHDQISAADIARYQAVIAKAEGKP